PRSATLSPISGVTMRRTISIPLFLMVLISSPAFAQRAGEGAGDYGEERRWPARRDVRGRAEEGRRDLPEAHSRGATEAAATLGRAGEDVPGRTEVGA